jgi:hypothetical protein
MPPPMMTALAFAGECQPSKKVLRERVRYLLGSLASCRMSAKRFRRLGRLFQHVFRLAEAQANVAFGSFAEARTRHDAELFGIQQGPMRISRSPARCRECRA